MKRFWRVIRWPLAALLLVLLYAGYRIGWGKPFTVHQLADRYAVELVLTDPELLTGVGIVDGGVLDRHSGLLTAVGPARKAATLQRDRDELETLREFDRAKLSRSDQMTWDVLDSLLTSATGYGRFDYLSSEGVYPLNAMNGSQVNMLYLLESLHVIGNDKLAENYVRRLEAAGAKLDALNADLQRQAGQGLVMPQAALDRSLSVAQDSIREAPGIHSLVRRLTKELESIDLPAERRSALIQRATVAVRDSLYPAFRRQIELLESQRGEAAKQADGLGRLPQGAELYAHMLREKTTTDYSADEIHRIGLAEVARIEAQMQSLFASQGMSEGSLAERYAQLNGRPDQLFEDSDAGREQILAEFRRILTDAEALMPQYFSRRPQGSLQVLRVPEALQAGAAGASYYAGALDGSRPGTFYVNLRSVAEQPRYKMKTLAYHEGVPGHHFQIELAMRMKGMPLLRQQGIFNAYTEGWALYAEQLMADIGLYKDDPLGELGRLSDEMLRAVRLVVDTGIHAQGWTRARAIAYMMEKSGLVESDATGEIDRYIAMPAQACSYKIGQLKILELRERARSKLGERFDLRAFHDVVLSEGALPLTALEQLVDEWIAAQQAAGANAAAAAVS